MEIFANCPQPFVSPVKVYVTMQLEYLVLLLIPTKLELEWQIK